MMRQRLTRTANGVRTPTVRQHRPDYQILVYMGLLMLLGLIVMYAIGPQRANVLNNAYGSDYESTYFFVRQTIYLALALFAFTVTAYLLPVAFLQKHAGKILATGFIACAILFLLGNVIHVESITQCSLGACRWFNFGQFGLQPAELLKFGMLLFAAGFLGVRAKQGLVDDRNQTLIPLGIVTAVALGFVIVIQKDMGTGIALTAILATQLVMAGIRFRTAAMILGILAIVGVLLIAIAPHRLDRIATFFSGDSSSVDDAGAYHIAHAKIAIGSGGLTGVGIGNSVQATGYLPEAINDSVFAIMGETFGFVGLVGILALFTGLLIRLLKVIDHLVDIKLKLLVAGVFGWLGSHVILNVGAMIGIVPLTGITLPLLSYGGTSIVFIAAALGLAFQLSRYTVFGNRVAEPMANGNRTPSRRMVRNGVR